jgi:pimeloyl-ACP methyl ester carboxylesterase
MRLVLAALAATCATQALACGEVLTLPTHSGTTTRYALTIPQGAKGSLVLLAGGGGHLDLDERGCARQLKGNSLVQSQGHFQREGFATALVDAPSDYQSNEGLGGFRAQAAHAEDIGKVIADLRARIPGPVWVIGTSRGAISAANAAARLPDGAAPDGVVLTSAVTVGTQGGRMPWTSQTVHDAALERIRGPVLIVGHASDACLRSPASGMAGMADRIKSVPKQVVTVQGGPGAKSAGLAACEGRSPHAYVEQEAEVAAGIARFVRSGRY